MAKRSRTIRRASSRDGGAKASSTASGMTVMRSSGTPRRSTTSRLVASDTAMTASAAHERVLPGMAETGVRESQVVTGPEERGDVVHGDDRRETAPRGQRELRGVVEIRHRA